MKISKNIRLLSWFNFFSAFRLYTAIAVIYFSQITNSYALGISIFSIVQVANAVFEIPTGLLSDKVGRKHTIILGSVTQVFSLLCFATGTTYAMFVVGAILEGLALAFFSGNNDALLFDTVGELGESKNYHRYLGHVRSMLYPSLMIASLLGGILASISFPLVFWLSLIPQSLCIFLSFKMIEPKRHKGVESNVISQIHQAIRLLSRNIQLQRLGLAQILKISVEELLFQFQILFYNTLWPVWAVGLTRSIMAIGKFISFRYSGRLVDRFTAIKVLITNDITTRLIHTAAITFPSILSPVIMSSTSLLWGVSSVSKNKLLQENYSQKQRATMSSVISFLGNLLAGAVALCIGLVSDKIGLTSTLLILQLFFIPILYLYIKYKQASMSPTTFKDSSIFV